MCWFLGLFHELTEHFDSTAITPCEVLRNAKDIKSSVKPEEKKNSDQDNAVAYDKKDKFSTVSCYRDCDNNYRR